MTLLGTETSASLYLKDANSDKEYHCQIEAKDNGHCVSFQYGRRGGTLASGSKTPTPVELDEARKIFHRLVREKLAKGYSPGEQGNKFQGTEHAKRDSGWRPQLLNAIDESAAALLIGDPSWCMEPKLDGERRLVAVSGATVTGINRSGLTVGLPVTIAQALLATHRISPVQSVFDGEIIGDTYHVWDILQHDGNDVRSMPYAMRRAILGGYAFAAPVFVTPSFDHTSRQREKMDAYRAAGAEGVVFKNLGASYEPGRPASGGPALKRKFVASATVRSGSLNKGKRSVGMELVDNRGVWHSVGNLTIPTSHSVPVEGSVLEVLYLYAFEHTNNLFQPVFKALRCDQQHADCLLTQLQYKGQPVAP